ncbi:MAG: Holliday junction resolvase RuvX [Acidobacteria bacterium]|nr:Holliday junction resolvase RuvX [Acidobacteriota bacterium]MCH8971282.1 Holliday junction resolvase RuvX [Acidobacteriota bacterium]MCZ6504632.1 Holliday junction resolvase RuvX [Actinomycetota bacterium]MCZ6740082.1 Holliday junction resolvase RuvX [Actinomycetota bacterium]
MTRYLGVDYGTKRVGLAISDGLGLTARPLQVVARPAVVKRVQELHAEYTVTTVVVGLPTGLAGQEGASAAGARALGDELSAATGIPVEYLDERFTSNLAEEALLQSGMKRRERRETVDKVAAAIILQDYLDIRAAKGNHQAD